MKTLTCWLLFEKTNSHQKLKIGSFTDWQPYRHPKVSLLALSNTCHFFVFPHLKDIFQNIESMYKHLCFIHSNSPNVP